MGLLNRAGLFIGRRSALWDQGAAKLARQMERQGHAPEAIWSSTGTFRGADRRWRQLADNATLGEAYPGMRVRIVDKPRSTPGADAIDTIFGKRIAYDSRWQDSDQALAHEIQHLIQGREGFERGGNEVTGWLAARLAGSRGRGLSGDEAYRRLRGEVEARQVEGLLRMTPAQRRAAYPMAGQEFGPDAQLSNRSANATLAALSAGSAGLGGYSLWNWIAQ